MDIAIVILLVVLTALTIYQTAAGKEKRYDRTYCFIRNGAMDMTALEAAGFTTEALIILARKSGYFNIGDIDTAILEQDGSLSILPKQMHRALNPRDFNFSPVREGVPITVAKDGSVVRENLERAGISEAELMTILEARGRVIGDILLATITESGRVDVFEK